MTIDNLATTMLLRELGDLGDDSNIGSALSAVLGKGSEMDLGGIVDSMKSAGGPLRSVAESWLGEGAHDAISVYQLESVLGMAKMKEFSERTGIDRGLARKALSQVIPKLVDAASSGGNLLDTADEAGLRNNLARTLLR